MTSPLQFLFKTRTDKAAELLRSSAQSAAEIAQQVGFSHQGHLNYHFKIVGPFDHRLSWTEQISSKN